MKLYYNSCDISALGEISIKQSREMEGSEQPQRAKVKLEVTLDLFERSYDENRSLVEQLKAALLTPNATLQWTNDAVGVDYVNQTAALVSDDLPEEWGQYHQAYHLVFQYYEQQPGGAPNNLPLVFVKEGSARPFTFDVVNRWQHQASTERFSSLRKHRKETQGKIHVEGQIFADTSRPLADRRNDLAAQAASLVEQMNSAEGLMQFGPNGSIFNNTVRIDEFSADLNQLVNAINFSFTCHYTLFPDETDYATAEYTVQEQNKFTGETVLTLTGKIQAPDEDSAQAKLTAIIAQVLPTYGYQAGQQLSLETTPNAISANGDGDTFTEITFTAQWRKWDATNQKATLQGASAEPVPMGNVNRWRDRVTTTRFNPLRNLRERTLGVIETGGTWAADPTLDIPSRRAQLLAMQRALKAEIDTPEVTLVFGNWNQAVRVTEFTAEINQAETGIDWSLTADYIIFPDPDNYTIAQYEAATKDNFTGETQLQLTGKIEAATLALAQEKLAAIQFTATTQYGYGKPNLGVAAAQQLTNDVSASNLSTPDGDAFVEISFSCSWRGWKNTNQQATFQPSNGKSFGLGNVKSWRDHYAAQRFSEMRSQRRHATGSVEASGTIAGDMTVPVTTRRAALLLAVNTLKNGINCADGTLNYGATSTGGVFFSRVVRVEDFQCEINQAETGIDWSLSAGYSLFPNEGGYATAEFTVADRQDVETGDEMLAFNGKIGAPTLTLAQAKLTTLRTAVLSAYGWTLAQQLRNEQTVQRVYANGDATTYPTGSGVSDDPDGTTFIELSFNENYRRRIQGQLVGSTLSVSQREDIPNQTLLTTFAGTVTATGPTSDAAYAVALARAQALGANRESTLDSTAYLRSSQIGFEQRQITQNSVTEFVRLTFSYEYQSKLAANRAYMEMTTTTSQQMLGTDEETCSGFIMARDAATAQLLYNQQVLPIYEGQLILSQQTGVSNSFNQAQTQNAGQRLGAGSTWSTSGGSGTVSSSGFNKQHIRFEFQLRVYVPKLQGEVGIKYSMEVTRDFLTLDMRTVVTGSVYAMDRPTADKTLNALLAAMDFGSNTRSRRVEDRETDGANDVLLKLDFEEEFAGRVVGQDGVIEMEVSENIKYSGTRWGVQDLPFDADGSGGISIVQPCGIAPGSRTVTGSVTAATLATAQTWAKQQRALLTGDQLGGNYPQPEQWDTKYEFVPRIDGIASGEGENAKLFKVTFTFAEILPLYPAPA